MTATDLKVEKNLTILNGTNTAGSDVNNLVNLTVSRSVTINNGAGNTSTTIQLQLGRPLLHRRQRPHHQRDRNGLQRD